MSENMDTMILATYKTFFLLHYCFLSNLMEIAYKLLIERVKHEKLYLGLQTNLYIFF